MSNVRRLPQRSEEGFVAATERALAAMTWLTDSDAAMVALARKMAAQLEDADVKTVGWMGPHLANVLKSLGGSPAERRALVGPEQARGKLAALRDARSAG